MAINYQSVSSDTTLDLCAALAPELAPQDRIKLKDLELNNISRKTLGRKMRGAGKAIKRHPGRRAAATTVGVAVAGAAAATSIAGTLGAATPLVVGAAGLAVRLGIAGVDRLASMDKESEAFKGNWGKYSEYEDKWAKNIQKFDAGVASAKDWDSIGAALEYLAEALHYAAKRNEVAEEMIGSFCKLITFQEATVLQLHSGFKKELQRQEREIVSQVKQILGKMKENRK